MNRDNDLETTLAGLDAGLRVRHIATFDVQSCEPEDSAAAVFERHPDFDQFPVTQDGRVIGVIERGDGEMGGPVRDHFRRLDDSMLVSAEEPLTGFISLLEEKPHYRLVVLGTRIAGIVTRSDLIKLPVRLVAFMAITHLEILMADLIRARCGDDDAWLALLY